MSADPERFVLSFDTLRAWCQRQKYQFSENTQLGQLAVHYQILGQHTPLMILPQPPRQMVMFVMKLPFMVPAERRAAVGEATVILNGITYMGAWVLNRDTGELFFRATLPVLDIGYTDAGVLHAARVVVGTAESLASGMRAIALEGAAPATIANVAKP